MGSPGCDRKRIQHYLHGGTATVKEEDLHGRSASPQSFTTPLHRSNRNQATAWLARLLPERVPKRESHLSCYFHKPNSKVAVVGQIASTYVAAKRNIQLNVLCESWKSGLQMLDIRIRDPSGNKSIVQGPCKCMRKKIRRLRRYVQ